MRRFQKRQLLNIMVSMHAIHRQGREKLEQKDYEAFYIILEDCQNAAIKIGETIEQLEGEGTEAVTRLEQYCEGVYQASIQAKEISPKKIYKNLEISLVKAENGLKHIPERIEAVFLPYKASMWDSLESVWMAADRDPNCDAYVIPIPYYDKNTDGSFKTVHYEGNEFPDYVPITHYDDYNFENRRPDMIYIHNPYDQYNNVTSVHPFFYSYHLKQFTDMLVYIPYYSTSGGMSPGQGQCSAYYSADYIVVQSEKYRKYFASDIPEEKLLPLGSPKFDRVVNICKNPPEPPKEWKDRMAGKKVYFYNTSINGMLANTSAFLKKMEYVFRCFAGRQDACLLWRPHPLLESTFDSMRAEFRPVYDALKKYFMESDFGIYDDTPDIADTIALCDAYIGDAGSSVTSLFGIVGKPVFILNNNIDCAPGEDDWRGEIIKKFFPYGNNQWMITQGNKLYQLTDHEGKYRYYCDLSDYAYGDYYLSVMRVNEKDYVCPANAQDILIIGSNGIKKKIKLKHCIENKGAFCGALSSGRYLFLIPNRYPAIVRYDTLKDEVAYLQEHLDIFAGAVDGEWRIGGFCVHNGYLFLTSPVDNHLIAIHAETGETQILTTKAKNTCGCIALLSDKTDLWFLPYSGCVITRWNPETGKVWEYANYPKELQGHEPSLQYPCMKKLFHRAVFCGDYVYLSPLWANMYVRLDKRTGKMIEWKPPFNMPDTWKNGYYFLSRRSGFSFAVEDTNDTVYRICSFYDRKFYDINLETNELKEIDIEFDLDELYQHEPGFHEYSEWLQYACQENAFNSLPDLLAERIAGEQFDKDRSVRAYEKIAANNDGTSGEKIYNFVRAKLSV